MRIQPSNSGLCARLRQARAKRKTEADDERRLPRAGQRSAGGSQTVVCARAARGPAVAERLSPSCALIDPAAPPVLGMGRAFLESSASRRVCNKSGGRCTARRECRQCVPHRHSQFERPRGFFGSGSPRISSGQRLGASYHPGNAITALGGLFRDERPVASRPGWSRFRVLPPLSLTALSRLAGTTHESAAVPSIEYGTGAGV